MRFPLLLSAALLATVPRPRPGRYRRIVVRMSTAPRVGNMNTKELLAFHEGVRREG